MNPQELIIQYNAGLISQHELDQALWIFGLEVTDVFETEIYYLIPLEG